MTTPSERDKQLIAYVEMLEARKRDETILRSLYRLNQLAEYIQFVKDVRLAFDVIGTFQPSDDYANFKVLTAALAKAAPIILAQARALGKGVKRTRVGNQYGTDGNINFLVVSLKKAGGHDDLLKDLMDTVGKVRDGIGDRIEKLQNECRALKETADFLHETAKTYAELDALRRESVNQLDVNFEENRITGGMIVEALETVTGLDVFEKIRATLQLGVKTMKAARSVGEKHDADLTLAMEQIHGSSLSTNLEGIRTKFLQKIRAVQTFLGGEVSVLTNFALLAENNLIEMLNKYRFRERAAVGTDDRQSLRKLAWQYRAAQMYYIYLYRYRHQTNDVWGDFGKEAGKGVDRKRVVLWPIDATYSAIAGDQQFYIRIWVPGEEAPLPFVNDDPTPAFEMNPP